MANRKRKGRASAKSAAQSKINNQKFTGNTPKPQRDMSAAALRRFVLMSLRSGPKHTYWFRAQGCSHPAARVMELVRAGYPIVSSRVAATDSDGFTHRNVAMYELVGGRQ